MADLASNGLVHVLPSSSPYSLNEVLEYAEDLELDIPKIWDYLAETLTPALSQPPLHFHTLTHIYPPLLNVGKAADLVAKVLRQVKLQQSETAALSLWSQSQLEWTSLGVKSEDVEEFLSGQVHVHILGKRRECWCFNISGKGLSK